MGVEHEPGETHGEGQGERQEPDAHLDSPSETGPAHEIDRRDGERRDRGRMTAGKAERRAFRA